MSEVGWVGRELRVAIDGTVIAAVKAKRVTYTAEPIDETQGERDGWRYLIDEADHRRIDVSVDGVATVENYNRLLEIFYADEELTPLEILHPDESVEEGDAFLVSLEHRGEHAGFVGFSAVFYFSGDVPLTPPPPPPDPPDPEAILLLPGITGTSSRTAYTLDGDETWQLGGLMPAPSAVQGWDQWAYAPPLGRILATWAGNKMTTSDDVGQTWTDEGGLSGLNWEAVQWCSGFGAAGRYILGSSNAAARYSATGKSGSWSAATLPSGNYRPLFFAYSASRNVAIGAGWSGASPSAGACVRTTDGATWAAVITGYGSPFVGADYIEELDAFFLATSTGVILRSTDGGETFDLVTDFIENLSARTRFFYAETYGALFLTSRGSGPGYTWRSVDGGTTWTKVHTDGGTSGLFSPYTGKIYITPYTNGTVADAMFVSEDGGDTWAEFQPVGAISGGNWIDVMAIPLPST